jgi:transcriptional regulator with XRE-family HTH domain
MGMTKRLNQSRRFFLRERRQAAGLTQQELAERCNTTKGMISSLETGSARYNEDWLLKIAEALQISPADLLVSPGGLTAADASDERLKAIVRAWQNMPEFQRDTLTHVAKTFEGSAGDAPEAPAETDAGVVKRRGVN